MRREKLRQTISEHRSDEQQEKINKRLPYDACPEAAVPAPAFPFWLRVAMLKVRSSESIHITMAQRDTHLD